jgi:hypothetical protein
LGKIVETLVFLRLFSQNNGHNGTGHISAIHEKIPEVGHHHSSFTRESMHTPMGE